MVTPVYLFSLASQHANWASVGQAVVAGNVANANTPGYTARAVQSFASVLNETELKMASTSPGHISSAQNAAGPAWEVHDTGRGVAIEREMVKADLVRRSYALDTTVMSAFHRMMMTSVRSGV